MIRHSPKTFLALALWSCAHPAPIPEGPLTIDGGLVVIEAEEPADRSQLPELSREVSAILPSLQKWGGLRTTTRIVVLPSHEALEERVHHIGYPWLRAWARYDVVFLQSPRTFASSHRSSSDLDELLLHELTHCAMYQAASGPTDWSERDIPLWFREGLASWTAGQAPQRWSVDKLSLYLRDDPSVDPLGQGDRLYRNQEALVYSAAHWAFASLVREFGEEKIRALLATMKTGQSFPMAFHAAFGVDPRAFELQLESGWRSS